MSGIKNLISGAGLCALLLAPAGIWAAGANTVADTHINSGSTATNYGTAPAVNIGAGYTGLIQFDLSSLPAGLTAAQISKATMVFYVNTVVAAGAVDVAQVTSAWTETGVNFGNRPTYLSPFALGVATGTSKQYVTVDVTQLVKDWVTGVATNFGVQIAAAAGAPTTTIVLDSKENQTTSHPAFLDVVIQSAGGAGPSGPSGPSGPLGPAGATGPSGPQGTSGAAGPSGPLGPAGASGPSGPQGTSGAAGPSGPLGPAGASGPSGPQGTAGAAGPSGPLGPAGATGPSGPQGTAGAAGPSGPLGPAGATGPSGPQGTAGAAGPSGPLGPAGATGPSGPQGTAGAAGPSGAQGPSGPSGPQGNTGNTGSTGAQGPSGPSGPAGANGAGVFGAAIVNPNNLTPWYMSLNGDSIFTTNAPEFTGIAMPVACTFNILRVTLFAVSGGAQDTVTVTLTKNGVDTGLSCPVLSSATANTITTCSAVSPTVPAAVGDLVGYHFTQTNNAPIVRIGVGTRCN